MTNTLSAVSVESTMRVQRCGWRRGAMHLEGAARVQKRCGRHFLGNLLRPREIVWGETARALSTHDGDSDEFGPVFGPAAALGSHCRGGVYVWALLTITHHNHHNRVRV